MQSKASKTFGKQSKAAKTFGKQSKATKTFGKQSKASCGLVLGACSLREHRNGCVVVSWRLPSRLASPWLLTGMQMYFLASQASC